MNIREFKEKVYKRIISQYLKDVKRQKMRLKDTLFLPLSLGVTSILFTASYGFHTDTMSDLDVALRLLMCFSGLFFILVCFLCLTSKDSLQDLRNRFRYKQCCDNFWQISAFSFPVLNNNQLYYYLKVPVGWYCQKEYTDEERNHLVRFTSDEFEEMKTISFNQAQKDFILNKVKNNEEINFYSFNRYG